jgi:ribulose-5-phosphate 4-epimerase/fuculose-1-phosphate aldolase
MSLGSFFGEFFWQLMMKISAQSVKKSLLRPKKIFGKRKPPPHQEQALELVKRLEIRYTNSRSATEESLYSLTRELSSLFEQDIDADNRRFGINFLDQYTKDITIEEMLTALARLDPRNLSCIVAAVVRELKTDPAVKLISTRDVFEDVTRTVEGECRGRLKKAELIAPVLGHSEDLDIYKSQHYPNGLMYQGIDPQVPLDTELFKEMRTAQKQMKAIGLRTSREKCSRTHIVMSTAIGEGWLQSLDSKEKLMVITAGKTDKTNLLIPSQTPVVAKVEGKLVYYGDETMPPSSEALSHWTMHEQLSQEKNNWPNLRSIFHAHLIDFIELSRRYNDKAQIQLGDKIIPNIDWEIYGTPKLGQKIARAIVENGCRFAMVKEHGPWFFEPTQEEAYNNAIRMVNDIRSQR